MAHFCQEFDKGKALEENIEKLAIERRRSEELLYRMMPKAIADRLRLGGKAVETCEVHEVDISTRSKEIGLKMIPFPRNNNREQ